MDIETCVDTEPGFSGLQVNKLGLCEVCARNNAKYTCPKCEVKTCCLDCSKIHKAELECDGKRNRTTYVPQDKFTNLDTLSDYRLLEEIQAKLDSCRRNLPGDRKVLPSYLYVLQNEASSRKICIKFLPRHFSRHKNNRTRYNFKTKKIYWQIEWIFVNSDNLKLTDTDVCEDTPLKKVIDKYLKPQDDKCLNERLQYYQAAGFPGIRLFLRADEKGAGKFYELDLDTTLRRFLKNKTIIEYPEIHVSFRDCGGSFNVIDSDSDDDSENDERKSKNFLYADDDDEEEEEEN